MVSYFTHTQEEHFPTKISNTLIRFFEFDKFIEVALRGQDIVTPHNHFPSTSGGLCFTYLSGWGNSYFLIGFGK